MQKPISDFDAEEQELASTLAQCKSSCPPLDVLLAVGQGVLPAEVEDAATKHISLCKLCTRLLADITIVSVTDMTIIERQRVASKLTWMKKERPHIKMWIPLAIAAVLILCVGGFIASQPHRVTLTQGAEHRITYPTLPKASVAEFSIPLEPLAPPESAVVLTRGRQNNSDPSTSELLPAFTAYNQGNYAKAVGRFQLLTSTYPNSSTTRLYLGVSELFLHRDEEAKNDLRLAETTSDSDVTKNAAIWYEAVAANRLHSDKATLLLQRLCGGKDAVYSVKSCALLKNSP